MLEAVALVEHALQLAAKRVAVGISTNKHVGRQGREAARHRPHMEVVHFEHAVLGHDRASDLVRVDTGR